MNLNNVKEWLNYWKNSLADADRKSIRVANDPIKVSIYFLDNIPKKYAQQLWNSSQAKEDTPFIPVDICPCSYMPVYDHAKTGKDENEIIHPFWIPAKMFSDGTLAPMDKPFFVRDYLSPNPDLYYQISSIDEVDKSLRRFDFDIEDWEEYWNECENFFQLVTEETFEEYNKENEKKIYVEKGEIRNVSLNILSLYDHITDNYPNNSLLNTLIGINKIDNVSLPSKEDSVFNLSHIGQMSDVFPLSVSQRESMFAYTKISNNDILAVNGPPGTGKTTLLQSVVANSVVRSVVEKRPPELIVASSANNQAITNILDSFALESKSDFTERWLPDINSLGLYFSSNINTRYQTCTSSFGDGFINDYEQEGIDDKIQYFFDFFSKHFLSVETLDDCLNILRQKVLQKVNNIEKDLLVAKRFEDNILILKNHGFETVEELKEKIANLSHLIDKEEQIRSLIISTEQKLIESKKQLSLYDKLFYFFPKPKARRTSAFQRVVLPLELEKNIDFSNYNLLNHKINDLIIASSERKSNYKNKTNTLNSALLEIEKNSIDYKETLENWESKYKEPFEKLQNETGTEYLNLSPIEDMSVRLDISYRFEAFWYSIHYREAEYLLLLQEKKENNDHKKERGEDSYREKLQRIACITPIFISTFYSLPKYSTFYKIDEQPYFNLFDLLIVDEAGQVPPDVSIPSFSLAKKAIVVGDIYQIEPVWSVEEKIDTINLVNNELIGRDVIEHDIELHKKEGILCSSGNLMKMAQNACKYNNDEIRGTLLREHRRCLDSIISYCNKYVYHNKLIPKKGNDHNKAHLLPSKGFLHINSVSEKSGDSRRNSEDATIIAMWIHKKCYELENVYNKPIHKIIAVVSPYKSQAFLVKKELSVINKKKYSKIITGTVHALQGAEMEIVIFSSVLSKGDNTMFVNKQYNMLNVAVSRAKHSFLIFGNMSVLDINKNDPLGNLKKWLLENDNCELSNKIVFENIKNKESEIVRIHKLKEHVGTLRRAFEVAKKELIIVSPFISINAINDDSLIQFVKSAIDRGVSITVFTDSKLDLINGKLKENSAKGRELLAKNGINIKAINGIHNKTLIVDDTILVEGSFNWLSATRDEESHYYRLETSIVLKGEQAKKYIKIAKEDLNIN